MMKKGKFFLGVMVALLHSVSRADMPGEGIVVDTKTGDYIITYANPVGKLEQTHFVPSTKIDPTVHSKFVLLQGMIRYGYGVNNGNDAKQPLIAVAFDPISSVLSLKALPESQQEFVLTAEQFKDDPVLLQQYVVNASNVAQAPHGWSCEVIPNGQTQRSSFRVACDFEDLDKQKRNGLQPGNSISGFSFFSFDLPGIVAIQLEGFGDMAPSVKYGGPTGELADKLDKLIENDFLTRLAAVPTIAVPIPFDAAALLDRIRTEMQAWPGKQLLDASFAAKLDGLLTSAANAYRLNNPKAAREHIESVRKLLSKEHHHVDHDDEDDEDTEEHKRKTRFTIDRLAARVLDFDLRYVLKRMEQGHEKDGHKKDEHRKDDPRKR